MRNTSSSWPLDRELRERGFPQTSPTESKISLQGQLAFIQMAQNKGNTVLTVRGGVLQERLLALICVAVAV